MTRQPPGSDLQTEFPATRAEAQARLTSFLPRAGRAYAVTRNADRGPDSRTNVSMLSPYVRHRLIIEAEIVDAVLTRHTLSAAEKFVQEVCWRTYWKGWLELRPEIWQRYLDDVETLRASWATGETGANRLARATAGETGIACFDAWARELLTTGYLHNHPRMWFASIWVYTLALPWQLGADFFLRHLIDGDPASNTLSWRWVCGLQTVGKTYLARADNIARYTDGRFPPVTGLAAAAPPLPPDGIPKPQPLRVLAPVPAEMPITLVLTQDDLAPETLDIAPDRVRRIVAIDTARAYPDTSGRVVAFKQAALADALDRSRGHFGVEGELIDGHAPDAMARLAGGAKGSILVTAEMPVGPTRALIQKQLKADGADGRRLFEVRRPWDGLFWPHAKAGFFKFKAHIPDGIRQLGLPHPVMDDLFGDRAVGV